MRTTNINVLPAFSLLFYLLCSCGQPENSGVSEKIDYNKLQHACVKNLTDVIVHDIFSPPVASRIYAYANIAYHHGIHFEKENAPTIADSLNGFAPMPKPDKEKKYSYPLAALKAFYQVAKALTFSKDSLQLKENELLQKFSQTLDSSVYNNSAVFGDSIGAAVLRRASADNYKETRAMARYSVFREPGKWEQTPPDYNDAVEPNWSMIRPLIMDSAGHCPIPAPPPYSLDKKSQYYKELMEVYNTSKTLTPQQDTIATYWDDNPFVTQHRGHLMFGNKKTTPAGHWMGIISIICQQTDQPAVRTAECYALASAAIFDGFIGCWSEKFKSRTVRPVTVINEKIEGGWSPLLQTPPFPEYPSGHSVITTAAATVLTHLLGDNISFTDTTEMEYLGLKRHFSSINQAADEACISRLYGGIHFRSAIDQGKIQGKRIGMLLNEKFK